MTAAAQVPHKRRDKRHGEHIGHVVRSPEGPSIRCGTRLRFAKGVASRAARRIAIGPYTDYETARVHRRVKWDDPYGGECDDTFVLTEGGDEMVQVSTIS